MDSEKELEILNEIEKDLMNKIDIHLKRIKKCSETITAKIADGSMSDVRLQSLIQEMDTVSNEYTYTKGQLASINTMKFQLQ